MRTIGEYLDGEISKTAGVFKHPKSSAFVHDIYNPIYGSGSNYSKDYFKEVSDRFKRKDRLRTAAVAAGVLGIAGAAALAHHISASRQNNNNKQKQASLSSFGKGLLGGAIASFKTPIKSLKAGYSGAKNLKNSWGAMKTPTKSLVAGKMIGRLAAPTAAIAGAKYILGNNKEKEKQSSLTERVKPGGQDDKRLKIRAPLASTMLGFDAGLIYNLLDSSKKEKQRAKMFSAIMKNDPLNVNPTESGIRDILHESAHVRELHRGLLDKGVTRGLFNKNLSSVNSDADKLLFALRDELNNKAFSRHLGRGALVGLAASPLLYLAAKKHKNKIPVEKSAGFLGKAKKATNAVEEAIEMPGRARRVYISLMENLGKLHQKYPSTKLTLPLATLLAGGYAGHRLGKRVGAGRPSRSSNNASSNNMSYQPL
jgi:hypothetical protein